MRRTRLGSWVLLVASASCSSEPSPPAPSQLAASPGRPPEGRDAILVPSGLVHTQSGARTVGAFYLDRAPVSVADYLATHDDAERDGTVLELASGRMRVRRVSVRHPRGLDEPPARDDEPATEVSAIEAESHCAALGGRLPTAFEWEHAARNARDDRTRYPWGDELAPDGAPRANTWEGAFPTANTLHDGFAFASPIGTYPPTPLGFVDLVGNVWQWTASVDASGLRVIKGGSHLCAPDVCHGFQIDASQSTPASEHLAHVGFRCAFDPR